MWLKYFQAIKQFSRSKRCPNLKYRPIPVIFYGHQSTEPLMSFFCVGIFLTNNLHHGKMDSNEKSGTFKKSIQIAIKTYYLALVHKSGSNFKIGLALSHRDPTSKLLMHQGYLPFFLQLHNALTNKSTMGNFSFCLF